MEHVGEVFHGARTVGAGMIDESFDKGFDKVIDKVADKRPIRPGDGGMSLFRGWVMRPMLVGTSVGAKGIWLRSSARAAIALRVRRSHWFSSASLASGES